MPVKGHKGYILFQPSPSLALGNRLRHEPSSDSTYPCTANCPKLSWATATPRGDVGGDDSVLNVASAPQYIAWAVPGEPSTFRNVPVPLFVLKHVT